MSTKRLGLALVLILVLSVSSLVLADTWDGSIEWDGQGSDSEDCGKLGDGPFRTEDGWIHWNLTQAGDVTEAQLLLEGSGQGYSVDYPESERAFKTGQVLQIFTPYFDLDTLEASLFYQGSLGGNSQFLISDYCPGVDVDYEELTVSKTADTSYVRTHEWDIDKWVQTENEERVNGTPKIWLYIDGSGDETATWYVDVTYEGYEDSNWNVLGEITIENVGTLDAMITGVYDVLAGEPIEVDCDVEFPYTLPVGETLICTYDADGYVEGSNEVTVTTEEDEYFADAAIIWGDPDEEINKTVTIKDISDLFGKVTLGTVTAPNGDQFTYDKAFAWEDYGADNCGSFQYDNTATIVETEQSASATLKVNVQCFIYDTAYAKGDDAVCFIPTFNNWGWTNPILPDEYEWDLWAGAAQCDTSKGTLVGSVTVVYDEDGDVTVTYDVDAPYTLEETHVYAGTTMFPQMQQGRRGWVDTVAPGQYYNDSPFEDGELVYVIAHAVVGMPDPDFGP